jgi:hypothetical protein
MASVEDGVSLQLFLKDTGSIAIRPDGLFPDS